MCSEIIENSDAQKKKRTSKCYGSIGEQAEKHRATEKTIGDILDKFFPKGFTLAEFSGPELPEEAADVIRNALKDPLKQGAVLKAILSRFRSSPESPDS